MGTRSIEELLGLTVRLHGIVLGRPVEVLLDREELKVVGLDVLCGDEQHRFLPLAAARLEGESISIASPLVLLEEDELAFYRSRTVTLGSLRGQTVERAGRVVGALRDLLVDSDLAPAAVVVDAGGDAETVPYDGSIRLDPVSRSAA